MWTCNSRSIPSTWICCHNSSSSSQASWTSWESNSSIVDPNCGPAAAATAGAKKRASSRPRALCEVHSEIRARAGAPGVGGRQASSARGFSISHHRWLSPLQSTQGGQAGHHHGGGCVRTGPVWAGLARPGRGSRGAQRRVEKEKQEARSRGTGPSRQRQQLKRALSTARCPLPGPSTAFPLPLPLPLALLLAPPAPAPAMSSVLYGSYYEELWAIYGPMSHL
jgi:hypothetical protein